MSNIARLFICELEVAQVWTAGVGKQILNSLNRDDYLLIYRVGLEDPNLTGSLSLSEFLVDAGIAEIVDVRKIRDEDFYENIANQIMKYADDTTKIFLVFNMEDKFDDISEYLDDEYTEKILTTKTLIKQDIEQAESQKNKENLQNYLTDDDFFNPIQDDEYEEESADVVSEENNKEDIEEDYTVQDAVKSDDPEEHEHENQKFMPDEAGAEEESSQSQNNFYKEVKHIDDDSLNDDEDTEQLKQQNKSSKASSKKKSKREEIPIDMPIPDTLSSVFGGYGFGNSQEISKDKQHEEKNKAREEKRREAELRQREERRREEEYERDIIRERERRREEDRDTRARRTYEKERRERDLDRYEQNDDDFKRKEYEKFVRGHQREEERQPRSDPKSRFGTGEARNPSQQAPPNAKPKETREDILRQIFVPPSGEQTNLKDYTELDDAKAKTISLLEDRLRKNINLLIMGFKEENPDDTIYIELISLLISAKNFEDFLMCWYVTEPNYPLDGFGKSEYNALRDESIYYSEACEILYGKDIYR